MRKIDEAYQDLDYWRSRKQEVLEDIMAVNQGISKLDATRLLYLLHDCTSSICDAELRIKRLSKEGKVA